MPQLTTAYSAERGEVEVDPPDGTRLVVCALFACAPVLEFDAESSVRTAHIINERQCLLQREILPGTHHVVSLFDAEGKADCDPRPPETAACSASLDRLLFGCWAYDEARVSAASRLEVIDPRTTFLARTVSADCAAPGTEGYICVVEGSDRMGNCGGGKCMPHCQSARECAVLLGHTTADAGPTSPCSYSCEALPGRSDLGRCTPAHTALP